MLFKRARNTALDNLVSPSRDLSLRSHLVCLLLEFKKIKFKNIQIHGLSDCLAKGVKILDGMKCSPLFAPIPLYTWKSEIQLSSGIIIMLFLLSYEVHIMLNKSI